MHRRRTLSVALVALIATACGDDGRNRSEADGANADKPVVGVILPDDETSSRWVEQDRPKLAQALRFAGVEPLIEDADNDEGRFASIADDMIRQRVDVLVTTPLSPEGGADVEAKAKAAGIPVINYDRISMGGHADYYVSFDNINVGELQAEGLLKCLGDKPGAHIIELQGAPNDNNATLFADGQHRKLRPLYDNGTLKLAQSHAVDKWDVAEAKVAFTRMLDANDGRVDGVVAANDGLAGAAIEVLKERGLAAGRVPVTGQDATLDGLRAILRGDQCMTVYKPIRDEAEAAARLAAAVAKGDLSGADDLATGNTRDLVSGRDVKSVLLGADLITAENVRQVVVAENAIKPADLCAGDLVEVCADLEILIG
ncbi:D-xylose transport system substrate-binding protein [Saccharothrix ecbatanensis]|uniref:D-xylose transport system substrate-binding protein n=1 Tax=Saccharothrix ecbatanensis TaxID=1105145 RepID=A0A7W9M0K7_9PSEU|nr:substrate-binding domain-containing protein [Saccharothrix ecbatanensis]MBB5802872.1 D-xylose transport system substrate-binding protein [Saccharothrix ecbatanensis]